MERFEINNYFLENSKEDLAKKWYIDSFNLKKIYDEIYQRLNRELLHNLTEDAFLYLGNRIKQLWKALIYLIAELNFIEKDENGITFFGYTKDVISDWIQELAKEEFDEELIFFLDTILESEKIFELKYIETKLKKQISKNYTKLKHNDLE